MAALCFFCSTVCRFQTIVWGRSKVVCVTSKNILQLSLFNPLNIYARPSQMPLCNFERAFNRYNENRPNLIFDFFPYTSLVFLGLELKTWALENSPSVASDCYWFLSHWRILKQPESIGCLGLTNLQSPWRFLRVETLLRSHKGLVVWPLYHTSSIRVLAVPSANKSGQLEISCCRLTEVLVWGACVPSVPVLVWISALTSGI